MKTNKMIAVVAIFAMMAFTASVAFAESAVSLEVTDASGSAGSDISIEIKASGTGSVAGAAFTIVPDTGLTIKSVSSTFFDTFVDGAVDGYPSPLVTNPATHSGDNTTDGSMKIAAARADARDVSGKTLFTLTVSANPTEETVYNVKIEATGLTNSNAGYGNGPDGKEDTSDDGDPVPIDLLIGIEEEKYPVMLAFADISSNVDAGNVTVTVGPTVPGDDDEDLMEDAWEIKWFGDTTTSSGGESDIDGDGYKDTDEYQQNGINDADGKPFCPIFMNAKDETNSTFIEASRTKKRGDVDGDGDTEIEDIQKMFQFFLGTVSPTAAEKAAANVSDDNDEHATITITDVQQGFQVFLGTLAPN